MTLQPKDGAFSGNYKVQIAKEVPDRVFTREELLNSGKPLRPTFTNKLPAKYAKPDSTPLSITLEKKGDKNIVFELTD